MAAADDVVGQLVDEGGSQWYRIDRSDRLDPFLTMVVSADDLWAFVSSAGPLTMGRIDADRALLPYETDDRLHRAAGLTGPVTVLARTVDGRRQVWRPHGRELEADCTRSIARETSGTALRLEETNHAWGVSLRCTWAPSARFGWTRTVQLRDVGGGGHRLEVLDGLLDVLPPGVDVRTQAMRSNLVDAYRRSEVVAGSTASLHVLESLITDLAEPAESLAATLVWSSGLPSPEVLLGEEAVAAVVAGEQPDAAPLRTGRRGSHLLHDEVQLPAGGTNSWQVVVDGPLGHADLHARLATLAAPDAATTVAADAAADAARVRELVAMADADQATGDPVADAHHRSNVLFNAMRGGVLPYGDDVPVDDLRSFLAVRNREVAARHAPLLDRLPPLVGVDELRREVAATGDTDLLRILHGYLPLTFSRRHGDPSRPWNSFSIRVRDDEGEEVLTYEGNWRDIFQNWEALLRSFPTWYPHVVATFVDSSTVDGFNAYRISRDGIDWEVPDPDDPWSNIGYWGDHQLVYLDRLLRGWLAVHPDAAATWLTERRFSYADVPYVLAGHEQMLADPRNTVTFDQAAHERALARVARLGSDGRLVTDEEGGVVHVTFLEKLLVPALAKLCAYVAGGGIWMNTQRPEWNDANNALAGHGLSMVTLFHLEQYLSTVGAILDLAPDAPLTLSAPVATWLDEVTAALADADPAAARDDARARRALLDRLGSSFEAHRERTRRFDDTQVRVDRGRVEDLLGVAAAHLGATVDDARRDDGLFESYRLVDFPGGASATVESLEPMLEGQVAALGSSALADEQVEGFIETLHASPLHRDDIDTFLLYPATPQPPFLERNRVRPARADELGVPDELVGTGRVLERGDDVLHFRAGLDNADTLDAALDGHDVDDDVRAAVHQLYEEVFDHHSFTGRSGGMHGYEGLGSTYWHMVSKLLVALQERFAAAAARGAQVAVLDALARAYRRVRDGLGFRTDPATFGAFPTDCYSHTPAHGGAQQPGMTGQVKEQVLVRLGEVGLRIAGGTLRLAPSPLLRDELDSGDGSWTVHVCGVPVTVRSGETDEVVVQRGDGQRDATDGTVLPHEHAAALFGRTGDITHVTFTARDPLGR